MLKMPLKIKRSLAMITVAAAAPNALAQDRTEGVPECSFSHEAEGSLPAKAMMILDNLPSWLKDADVPNISAAYVDNGELAWSLACGEKSAGAQATLMTRYNTASIAKPVVGEVVLRRASEGRLSLDEPMAEVWLDPDIAGDPRAALLTPRIALAHQTGFANWRRMTDGVLSFRWDPGTQVGYSGEGIRYVVRFLEKKFDQPFNDLAQKTLFDQAGMTGSAFIFKPEYENHVAYRWLGEEEGWGEPYRNEEALGAGRLWTTGADYARFMIAVLTNAGTNQTMSTERGVINRDDVERMCGEGKRKPAELCPEAMGFGVGWYVYEFGERRFYGHTGANWGEVSFAVMEPAARSGLVVFANGKNGNAVISKAARTIYGDDNPVLALEGL